MAAPKGNQFWKARTKHGRDKLFASAELLEEACQEYFQWVEDNPLYESRLVSYQGESKLESVPKMRAMTIGGLCIFLDITTQTWFQWRQDNDFADVVTRVEQAIREQKFAGAAAEMLNPNIIARDLGLRDSTDTKHSGHIDVSSMTPEQLSDRAAQLLRKMQEDEDQTQPDPE